MARAFETRERYCHDSPGQRLLYADIRYRLRVMIRSFADRDTARLWARKTLRRLNAAVQLNDLRNPPGNRLESLQGIRASQYTASGSMINGASASCGMTDTPTM